MKNPKKKLAVIIASLALTASSAVPMSASAATYVDWSVASFKPYTGKFYADGGQVKVQDLKWASNQTKAFNNIESPLPIPGLKYGIEFEFRPSVNTNSVWHGITGKSSNLPDVYYEFQPGDGDDVSIGCGNLKKIVAEQSYYATMTLGKRPSFNNPQLPYTFEVESGWGVSSNIDYKPAEYTVFKRGDYLHNNVQFGQTYSWSYSG